MTQSVKNKIFKISFVIAALGSGVIFILNNLLTWWHVHSAGEIYNFFSFQHPDPWVDLAPMLRAIQNGHWWVSDGRVIEHLLAPNLWSFAVPVVLSPLILLFKNITLVFLAGTFISAVAVFCIVYVLANQLIRHRVFSLGFAFIFLVETLIWEFLFPVKIANLKIVARSILHLGSYATDAMMSRYISFSILPAWPFFALAFLTILLALKTRKRIWIIAAGLCLGLLVYLVLTDALYLSAGLAIIFVLLLFQRDWAGAKTIFWIFLIAGLASAGYLFNFFTIRQLPWAGEFYARLGMERTHAFRFSFWREYLAYGLMSVIVWQWGKKYNKKIEATFVVGFILAVIAVLNVQVITGMNPTPTAWLVHQTYFGLALGWLICIFWAYDTLAKKNNLMKYGAAAVLIVLIFSATIRVVATDAAMAEANYKHYFIPKNIKKSLDWLNNYTPVDSVVVTPSLAMNIVIPSETHNYVMMPVAITSPAAQTEIRDRVFIIYKLFSVSLSYLEKTALGSTDISRLDDFAIGIEHSLFNWLYDSTFEDNSLDAFFRGRNGKIPDNIRVELLNEYEKYPVKLSYLLSRYRMDYFYVGPYEQQISSVNFDRLKFLEKVYDDEGVRIYKLQPGA